jgi:hypothetical protein
MTDQTMAFETISTRAALVLVAILFSAIGCGGDACVSAEAHLTECLASTTATSSTTGAATKCDGEPACNAECINGATCSTLKDFYSAKPTDTSKVLLDCVTKCQTP